VTPVQRVHKKLQKCADFRGYANLEFPNTICAIHALIAAGVLVVAAGVPVHTLIAAGMPMQAIVTAGALVDTAGVPTHVLVAASALVNTAGVPMHALVAASVLVDNSRCVFTTAGLTCLPRPASRVCCGRRTQGCARRSRRAWRRCM
jgi:hypothetical protein